mmetsp:Transcript_22209/g.37615  ORF Transcript_22209/g.37615 Transcript_22209/m.37615 type:complete len:513 (-) Transcript_22209:236-1774(-)
MPLSYHSLSTLEARPSSAPSNVVVIGTKSTLGNLTSFLGENQTLLVAGAVDIAQELGGNLSPSREFGAATETHVRGPASLQRIAVCVIPTGCSRHNTPGRPHAVADLVRANKGSGDVTVIVLNENPAVSSFATACAVSRSFSTYHIKKSPPADVNVTVFMNSSESEISSFTAESLSWGIRKCQALVDCPPNILHTDEYAQQAQDIVKELQANGYADTVSYQQFRGEELAAMGMFGIHGVGKASTHPSVLAILSYTPKSPEAASRQSVCMVGKGIVFDTGGLSIKSKEGMPGMKGDMGGSAGILCAWKALVENSECHVNGSSNTRPIHALLCLAENSVGPDATRPDDVHVFYSGKTVEINNTDAEGRLVLGDGCAYAARHLNPSHIIDMATLTGAQGVATGQRHGAVYTNDDDFEQLAIRMGKFSGDLVHPIPYAPEFFVPEFASSVADMKNSVACRSNAQSSCAGQFIGNHIEEFLDEGGKWMHIDMAYPSHIGPRATGYGVALLYCVVRNL